MGVVLILAVAACAHAVGSDTYPTIEDDGSDAKTESSYRPLLAIDLLPLEHRVAARAVAEFLRKAGRDPQQYFILGTIRRDGPRLRIHVVHERDTSPECRHVFGDCSGWSRIYELNADSNEVLHEWRVQ